MGWNYAGIVVFNSKNHYKIVVKTLGPFVQVSSNTFVFPVGQRKLTAPISATIKIQAQLC